MGKKNIFGKKGGRNSSGKKISGFNIKGGISAQEILLQMQSAGLQASQAGKAAQIIEEIYKSRKDTKIFLTFTTNLVTSGLREVFAKICKERKVDAIITAIGSVEEDVMKSFSSFSLASFEEDDIKLHKAGRNRVGNIIIENESYVKLEKLLQPFFAKEHEKQKRMGRMLGPHEIIHDLGAEIKDENSFVYWAAKNNIPVFCPAVCDGAFGLQLYFYKQSKKDFGIDASADLLPLGRIVLDAKKTAGIILGGGVAKHHAIGANLLREGFDYAIYVSTGTPYDGSLSGARTSEAVSWGKIKEGAKAVHVEADASIIFPLLATKILK
ncbi:deoxyhypusine synthase [Candidatus Micrarchaeota archaeon CG10_big_fil_rev_8_21_14_0_10_45_29]|nr:MAG: deoxyhypusine synthase [Candidatus Micrarchaeota archaeon CG10_big_fil_rev_8_21_14_0_10_45_29]